MHDPAEIRWTVGAEQIDPDRWAQAISNALQGGKERDGRQVTRWGPWPAVVMSLVLLVALAALNGAWFLLVVWVPPFIIIGGLVVLSRRTVHRTAEQIRSTPSALEPFTFTAGASGTHSESVSSSESLAWGRYRDVMLDQDLIVLTLDNRALRVLPVAALSSGQSATQVVETLKTWIVAAHSSVP